MINVFKLLRLPSNNFVSSFHLSRKNLFIAVFFFYSLIAFLALRVFIFKSGTIGHNWDWSIPALPRQLAHMGHIASYAWLQAGLGLYRYATSSSLLFGFLGTLGYLGAGGEFVSKFLPFMTIVISGTAMFYLLEDILKKNSKTDNLKFVFCSSIFGGIFYSLSPYVFNDIIGGGVTQFLVYSLFPLAIYFLRKTECPDKFLYIFLLALVLSIISFSLQRLFLVSVVLLIYPIFSDKSLRLYKNLLKCYILFGCLNFYWISFIFWGGGRAGLALGKEYLLLSTIKNGVPSLHEIFVGLGYFRDFFQYSIAPNIHTLWFISSYGLLIIAIFSILTFRKIEKKNSLFWVSLFLISIIFSTGAKPPFGNLVLWMYNNIPLMVLFKSPQHLLILSTFSLSVILGLGFFSSISRLEEANLRLCVPIYTVLLFAFLIVWLSPFLTGNFGLDYLSSKGGGNFLDTYELSPGYKKVLEEISVEAEDFRILPLPVTHSPYYLKTEYQNEGQGGDPTILYSEKPFVVLDMANVKGIARFFEKLFYGKNVPKNISKLLGFANVKYIILRKDVRPIFPPFATMWNYSQVHSNLQQIEDVRLLSAYKYVSLWENNYFLPHIYASSDKVGLEDYRERRWRIGGD